jgi:hypothetical protein
VDVGTGRVYPIGRRPADVALSRTAGPGAQRRGEGARRNGGIGAGSGRREAYFFVAVSAPGASYRVTVVSFDDMTVEGP